MGTGHRRRSFGYFAWKDRFVCRPSFVSKFKSKFRFCCQEFSLTGTVASKLEAKFCFQSAFTTVSELPFAANLQ